MRRISFFVVFFLMIFGSMAMVQAETTKFPDVSQYKEEINYLTEKSIINGFGDGTFGPNKNLTRMHAVLILLRAKGITDLTAPDPNMTDMKPGTNGYAEVAKAVELGIISGKTAKDGSRYFDPNTPLTRGQMAKIMVEAEGMPISKKTIFSDVSPSNGFHDYISTLAEERITSGYGDGTYRPNERISRAHFAVFVARMLNDDFKPTDVPTKPEPSVPSGQSYYFDKTKVYTFHVVYDEKDQGNAEYSYSKAKYVGDPKWDLWQQYYDGRISGYQITKEDSKGLYSILCLDFDGIDCSDMPMTTELLYPLQVGKKWETYKVFEKSTFTITAMGLTYTVKGGTFTDVVELKDSQGWIYYYAPNIGPIKVIDNGKTIHELLGISDVK